MSANTNNSPIFDSNTNEAILASNEQSYDDLIGYCALRKQFSRIIPSYYTEIQKQTYNNKKQNKSSIEEYKKLKEEINTIQESIELLKESKQKKLKQIEELRGLMRKVGNKQISYKIENKKINNNNNNNNNNNIINTYCTREKSEEGFRCTNRKGSNNCKVSSDEGLSMATTTSGLSSGKDDDAGAEEGGAPSNPQCYSNNNNCWNSSSSCCFKDESLQTEFMLRISERDTTTLCENN